MRLSSESDGFVHVITLREPRLDSSIAAEFKAAVRDHSHDGCSVYLLDLESVMFLDSSGMGALVGIMKQLGRDRKVELCSLTPTVHRVLRLTKVDTILRIHPDRESALASYSNALSATG